MEDVTAPGNGLAETFPTGGVLGDLDALLLGRDGGVSTRRLCSTLEESWIEGAVAKDVGVPRDRAARDVATRGGGCSGNVSFSRSHNSLIPALWSVDKSVFGNGALPTYDNWLVETHELCEALENEGVEVVVAICVAKVFKYFSVEADRELRGVTREVGVREAAADMIDRGLSGEM